MERERVWPGQLEVLVHKPDPKVQPPKVVQRIANPEAPGRPTLIRGAGFLSPASQGPRSGAERRGQACDKSRLWLEARLPTPTRRESIFL